MIAKSILKQLIIPEYPMGVYHKGGSNANGRNSIFDISHDYVKKVVPERKRFVFLANVILISTSCRSRTLVRISFHQQLNSNPHYALDIPDVR